MSLFLKLQWITASPSGIIALVLLVPTLGIVALGPLVAPYSISEIVELPGLPPSEHSPLGTDALGRDVYSRTLNGGRSVIAVGALATLLAYVVGLVVGLIAGYTRSVADPILMRGVDIVIAIPGLVLVLLLVTGFGPSIPVLLVGIALINLPGIARLIRSSTLELTTRGYVEAAVARGERMLSILWREVVPNLTTLILADVGIRFGYTVAFIASLNYLGLGVEPPTADWALMISENRNVIETNLWAVLAPGILLACLVIGVNLLADAYVQSLGAVAGRRARLRGRVRSTLDTLGR